MNLSYLNTIVKASWPAAMNPYYIRLKVESCHIWMITKFFRLASPIFMEKVAQTEDVDLQDPGPEVLPGDTYEWDLQQNVPGMLWKDLFGWMAIVFSAPVFYWFYRGLRHLEIYFYLDEIDEGKEWHGTAGFAMTDNPPVILEAIGNHSYRGVFVLRLTASKGVATTIGQQLWSYELMFRSHEGLEAGAYHYPAALREGGNIALYRIRGPSDGKNIFHHLSDKIICLLSPHENCGNRSQRACRGQPLQGAHQAGA